jgi:hypothetical protein
MKTINNKINRMSSTEIMLTFFAVTTTIAVTFIALINFAF